MALCLCILINFIFNIYIYIYIYWKSDMKLNNYKLIKIKKKGDICIKKYGIWNYIITEHLFVIL